MSKTVFSITRLVLCLVLCVAAASASDWRLLGPEGGDVRSLTYDPANPKHILLGTSAGQMFTSEDGGASWSLFAHLGPGDDYVLDHIIFNPEHPATIYVAGWSLDKQDEGDIFRSDDGGRTWNEIKAMHGKSVRALAMAASDPKLLIAGALDGVFRSRDGGETWQQISPEGHAEIKNIESIAIDPQNPGIIYAGTWHLPWKTEDGGTTWHSISKGIAFDSDMFSIIVDPRSPQTVFASACSGMYKSQNKAEQFKRILGLPHSAMRTRVLKQDTQRSSIVYAGTTGGLWKSTDGGDKWTLVTGESVIVNDVLVDPLNPDRVLVATDRGGVLASNDGFAHYTTSNRGFAHRVIGGVVVDNKEPSRLYVGVVNDKDLGGFFLSDDNGVTWRQSNRGLDDRDILSLQQAEDGTIYAGTNHGVLYLTSLNGEWKSASMIYGPLPSKVEEKPVPAKASTAKSRSKSSAAHSTTVAHKPAPEHVIAPEKAPRIRAFDLTGDTWFAATNDGVFRSTDHGKKWYGMGVSGENDFIAINRFSDGTVALVAPKDAFVTHDNGATWTQVAIPQYITGIYNLTEVSDNSLWLATREGALQSHDGGQTWEHVLGGLPPRNVFSVHAVPNSQKLFATALHSHGVFESADGGQTWHRSADTGVSIRAALPYQGRLLAASAYNGLLLQQGQTSETATAATRDVKGSN